MKRQRLWGLVRGMLAAAVILLVGADAARAESVLVWSTGNFDGDTPAIAAWLQASGQFTSVTGIDQDAAFTLPELLAYDKVLYFSNHNNSQDPTAVGDVLDDYADTGRRLVLATFAWANQGDNTLAGRIISEGTSPYFFVGSSLYTAVTMASNDGSPFFNGVNTVSGFYHDDVALSAGAVSRAAWTDGRSLLATKGNVVAVNLFPDDSFGDVGGDYRQLFVNALDADVAAVPEPATLGLLAIGGLGLLAIARRRA